MIKLILNTQFIDDFVVFVRVRIGDTVVVNSPVFVIAVMLLFRLSVFARGGTVGVNSPVFVIVVMLLSCLSVFARGGTIIIIVLLFV